MITPGLPRRHRLDLLLALGAFAAVYGSLAPELVRDWMESGDFSHGFIVPFVSVWLLWIRREELAATRARVYAPGLLLIGLAVAQYLVGVAASEYYLQRTSGVVFLGGWVLLCFGPGIARIALFPVAFLLFSIPPPNLVMNWVAFPLQLRASQVTEAILALVGIPAVRSGNVIHLENVSLEVARACSGLRSLVTLLALGAILAEGSLLPGDGGPRRIFTRVLVFLMVLPVAVAVNSLRVAVTAVIAAKAGVVYATGTAHDIAGFLMFVVSMALLLAWRAALTRGERWLSGSPRSS